MGYTVRGVLYTIVYALSAPSFLRWYAGDRRHKSILFLENVNYMFTIYSMQRHTQKSIYFIMNADLSDFPFPYRCQPNRMTHEIVASPFYVGCRPDRNVSPLKHRLWNSDIRE